MGTRNKVNIAGWISENISDNVTELDLGAAKQVSAPTLGVQVIASGSTLTTASSPIVLFGGATANVTASLPSITAEIVGKTFFLVTTGSNTVMLSASNPINFGAWTRQLEAINLVTCVAVSSSGGGFTWLASSGSAI